MNRFGTGNFDTLKKESIRDELLEFHKKWYSSNIMNLCVYSNHSIEELEKLVHENFSPIINKNVVVPSFFDPKPYDESNLGYIYKIEPVMQENKIQIFIPIIYTEKMYDTKPASYLSHCLGHEGEGSLLSALIREDLATGLTSYSDNLLNSFSYLMLSI